MAYLDHNATSPLRPEARQALWHALRVGGNAASVHSSGRAARALIEEARGRVAALAGARPNNVVFTSGGSEANALALWGAVHGAAEAGAPITRLFVSAIEHNSILANATVLAGRTTELQLETIPVGRDGIADLAALSEGLCQSKGRPLVALMAANNETGAIQPVAEAGALARAAGALLLVDAVQAAGKIEMPQADYVTLSAHKIGGPQGAGALILGEGAPFAPMIAGGGQERGRRAGTENLAGIAGFGAAAEAVISAAHRSEMADWAALAQRFEEALLGAVPDAVIFGGKPRLANTVNFAIPGIPAETALIALDLDGIMMSSGAACSSGKVKPSHVLAAMGIGNDLARCALRASFGWNSTGADVEAAITSIANLVARVLSRPAA